MLKEALEQSGVAGLLGWDDRGDGAETLFGRAWAAALYPFQLAITPTAIKAYLTTILFLTTSFVLLSISTTAYTFFYYNYIPQTDLERPVYLQYGHDAYPRAEVSLSTNALISQQPYDVSIVLHMPRHPINIAAGNFMVDLKLHSNVDKIEATVLKTLRMGDQVPDSALHHSRRPAILPYSSTTSDLVSKFLHLPLHVFSFHDSDAVTLTVPMFEEVQFARGKDNIPTHAQIEIQTQRLPQAVYPQGPGDLAAIPIPQLHIYSAKLVFQIRFQGLRYFIYNHRVLAFMIFSSLFYGMSISSLAIVWAVIATLFKTEGKSLVKFEKKDTTIKQEHVSSDPLKTASDYSTNKAPTLKRETDDSEDEGAGVRTTGGPPAFTPRPSGPASTSSRDLNAQPAIEGGPPEEHADDEEEESEDEWQQLDRLRRKMEKEARQRQMQHDSGIGTSMDSENTGRSGVVRRSGSSRGSGRD